MAVQSLRMWYKSCQHGYPRELAFVHLIKYAGGKSKVWVFSLVRSIVLGILLISSFLNFFLGVFDP